MNKKKLYLIATVPCWLLDHLSSEEERTTLVFLTDTVPSETYSKFSTFFLSSGASQGEILDQSTISYQQLLRMVFDADTVAVF